MDAAAVLAAPVFTGTTSPRELRALAALMRGPVTREALDRTAGSSNSPDVVFRLRKKGLGATDCLLCELRRHVDRDGRTVEPGTYVLTDEGRRRVRDWLDRTGMTLADLPSFT